MNITEEQKNNILEECLNTKRTYRVIARENRVNYEDVIAIIEEYCQKRGYKSLGRKQNGDVFKRTMEKITEIEEWCKENERKPRGSILGVKVARKGEPETEEQKEIAKELGVYEQVKKDGGWENIPSKTCGNMVTKAIEIANRNTK